MEWLFGDDDAGTIKMAGTDYSTLQGLLTLPVADPFENWSQAEKDPTLCPNTLGFQDNRLRLLLHAIQPTWLHRDHWHASRVNPVDKTVVIEHADQQAIIDAVQFYLDDAPDAVDWNEITSLSDLLLGVKFMTKGKVTVSWDCTLGKVIRRNKTAFHVWKRSAENIIETDKPTVSLLFRGMVTNKLNERLKRDMHVVDLL